MKLAVCIPTRGIITSRTIEAVQAMLDVTSQCRPDIEISPKWHISYDKPIPDGHTDVATRALNDGADLVLFVEEDVIPPAHALEAMLVRIVRGADWVFVDYPLNAMARSGPNCYFRNEYGEVIYTGFGCTLITREVFEAIEQPWFRTDRGARIKRQTITFEDRQVEYGGFDIWFGYQAHMHGFRLEVIPNMMARHVKLMALGKPNTNHGLHTFEEKGRHGR
jgi:hypothetical protein